MSSFLHPEAQRLNSALEKSTVQREMPGTKPKRDAK